MMTRGLPPIWTNSERHMMKTETNNLITILVVDDTPGSIGVVQAVLDRAAGSDLEVAQKLQSLLARGYIRQF